ncbi:MAG: ABC transporter ATP-binding protein/permease, partial [Bacilli bacterium]|nr:ABC transporter ATP-binding protein/permease [Bacilli bacterium]
ICMNSWIVAIEVLLYLVAFYCFSKKFLPAIRQNQKDISKEKDVVVAQTNETIRGIREIRALGIRESTNVTIKNLIRNIFYKNTEQMINEKNYYSVVVSLNNILETVVFITCIILICYEKTTFAFFMALTYYIYRFMGTIDWVMNLSTSYQKMKVSIERIDEILGNKLYKDEEYGTLHKTNIKGNIEFKNVNFQYSNEEKPIFSNFNLMLETNKKIAIVGKSGQGKTSLFNLLLRYFSPNQGVILIDDIPIEDFDEDSFHQNIAIIRQDPFLFNKTILENFQIINPKLSLKKVREACKTAEIDDYIMSLPKKYDTIIGEGGVNLSGGQKQRVAIARALLKNSKILLFDEATSALDNESQAKIKIAMDNLVKDHTIIIVAHRLSTIIDADIIHVVDKGQVVASGTHKKLLSKSEIYKSLYKSEM